MTINCDRWQEVAFSTSYFTTPQRVLVRLYSDIDRVDDIAGRKICATAGSSTIALLEKLGAKPVTVEARTDCLVALQEGRVEGIATHDTILHGLKRQDPQTTQVVNGDLDRTWSDYGIVMPKDDVAFVRFVNGVLERMRADGELERLSRDVAARHRVLGTGVPDPVYRSEP